MRYTARMKRWIFALATLLLLTACAPQSAELTLTPQTPAIPTVAVRTPTPTLIALPTDTPLPTATPSPVPSPTPQTPRLVVWEDYPPAQQAQFATEIITFQRENPAVQMIVQHYDDPAALVDGILHGRVAFDVVLGAASTIAPLQEAGLLQPMDAVFPENFTDEFAPVALAGASRDGDVWALPDTVGFHLLLFYNTDVLGAPPKTLSTLIETAENLSDGEQIGLVMNIADPLWVLPWVSAYGDWVVDDRRQISLNTPAMVSALETHARLVAAAKNRRDASPLTYTDARQQFLNGNAALLIDGDWMIEQLPANGSLRWAVASLPKTEDGGQPASLVLGRYWAVAATTDTRRKIAASQFLQFVTDPARQLKWMAQFGALPTCHKALTAPDVLTNAVWRVSAAEMQAGRGVPLGVDANRILDAMRQPLSDFLGGKIDAETAAARMQSAVE